MKKKLSIFKEIIITLLLCIAILLVLLVIFYDYNPVSKIVPNKVAYSTPENVKNETQEETLTEFEKTNLVYTVEGSDLSMYQKNGTYVKGKANPFAAASSSTSEENTTGGNTIVEANNVVQNTNSGNSTTNQNDSTGTFFEKPGVK